MPGLDPGIHAFEGQPDQRHGWPGQARPWRCGWVNASDGWYKVQEKAAEAA